MFKSLYFKIILLFVLLMVVVMAAVGAVLFNGVYSFYTEQFVSQLDDCFDSGLYSELYDALESESWVYSEKSILQAYSNYLGIDVYRNYYILDENGDYLDGSNDELGMSLSITPNIISVMSGGDGRSQSISNGYSDYAIGISSDTAGRSCIIYIYDSQQEMQKLSLRLFSIIIETVLFGLGVAFLLSFFLAKAISEPVQNLTGEVNRVMGGNFSEFREIEKHSDDEIGELTESFNRMSGMLKSTLDDLSDERTKLETIFTCLTDAVIAFRNDGSVISINKSASRLFAKIYSDKFNSEELFSELGIDYASAYAKNIKQYRQNTISEIPYGDYILDITISYLKYTEGKSVATGYIVVFHDVTERYELVKAQKEFVANVSHELGTPLSVIRGATESVLLNPDVDRETRDGFLGMAVDECESMKNIIDDLLTLSRIDNGRTRWECEEFDLSAAVKRTADAMRTMAEKNNQTINISAGHDIKIYADRGKLEQVIVNIISNSIKYTPDGGRIDILLRKENDKIRLYVRDNGIGIPKADLSRIFERFYRVEKSRSSDKGGTGLGLAIAKEIIDAHGGTIAIKSDVGVGTIFSITLPEHCAVGE